MSGIDEILDVDLLAFETGAASSRRAVVDGVMRSLASGFSRHLTKPVNFQALEAVIHETAHRQER